MRKPANCAGTDYLTGRFGNDAQIRALSVSPQYTGKVWVTVSDRGVTLIIPLT